MAVRSWPGVATIATGRWQLGRCKYRSLSQRYAWSPLWLSSPCCTFVFSCLPFCFGCDRNPCCTTRLLPRSLITCTLVSILHPSACTHSSVQLSCWYRQVSTGGVWQGAFAS